MNDKQKPFDLDLYCVPEEFLEEESNFSSYNDDGRLGRLRYWVYFLVLPVCVLVLYGLCSGYMALELGGSLTITNSEGTTIFPSQLIFILTLCLTYCLAAFSVTKTVLLTIRRCMDINCSLWWAVLIFVPFLNVVFLLYLLVARGNEDENNFGKPNLPPSRTIKALALILPLVGVWGAWTIFNPMVYQKYMLLLDHEMYIQI